MVMNNQKFVSVDMSDQELSNELVPSLPTLSSRNANWQNFLFEHHFQPAHEMPVDLVHNLR